MAACSCRLNLLVRESVHLNGSGISQATARYTGMWCKATFNITFKLNLSITALVITMGMKSEDKIFVK